MLSSVFMRADLSRIFQQFLQRFYPICLLLDWDVWNGKVTVCVCWLCLGVRWSVLYSVWSSWRTICRLRVLQSSSASRLSRAANLPVCLSHLLSLLVFHVWHCRLGNRKGILHVIMTEGSLLTIWCNLGCSSKECWLSENCVCVTFMTISLTHAGFFYGRPME